MACAERLLEKTLNAKQRATIRTYRIPSIWCELAASSLLVCYKFSGRHWRVSEKFHRVCTQLTSKVEARSILSLATPRRRLDGEVGDFEENSTAEQWINTRRLTSVCRRFLLVEHSMAKTQRGECWVTAARQRLWAEFLVPTNVTGQAVKTTGSDGEKKLQTT